MGCPADSEPVLWIDESEDEPVLAIRFRLNNSGDGRRMDHTFTIKVSALEWFLADIERRALEPPHA